MAALAQIQTYSENTGPNGRGKVKGTTQIFEGGLLGRTTAGFLRPFATGDFFAGHALEDCNNVAGADGAKYCKYRRGTYYATVPVFGSVTIANIGDRVWAVTDNHADLTIVDPGTTKTTTDLVGYIHDIDESGAVIIKFVARDN
ncbi:MAG: hypothetical protein JNL58_04455 [Planctomyces sp.]|nr:hypothetical protein [Planctomyces sp.]